MEENSIAVQRLDKGDSWSYTFDKGGTFDYICGIHPSMEGRIVVE